MEKKLEIPENVTVTKQGDEIVVKGPLGELRRRLWYPSINIDIQEKEVVVQAERERRDVLAMLGTYASHIRNMITGVTRGYEYRMKIVYSHFPIQVKVEGKRVSIANFLGGKKPRYTDIIGETQVKVNGDQIIITGINKEDVGQTMANIEQKTRIKGFDPRVFQDGIYLVEKKIK